MSATLKGMDRDMRLLVKVAIEEGWTVTRRKRAPHLRCLAPDGGTVTVPITPSDHRALKNARAQFRRHGLEV